LPRRGLAAACPAAATIAGTTVAAARQQLPLNCGAPDFSVQCYAPHAYETAHGVAPLLRRGEPSRHYAASAQRNSAAKARIARAAAGLIPAEAITFFYSGSTVAKTAASLSEDLRSSLTIVTNSLPIINEVSTWDDPHLVAIGGTYLPAYMCSVGPQSIEALEELGADVAVMGCDGLSADGGLTTPHQLVAQIGATIVNRARHIIVVADSTKVGRRGFTPIAPVESIHVLVTDQAADPAEVANLRARGVEVRLT